MPIGGEGLEDRIQRSRDDRFWRKTVIGRTSISAIAEL
jgi:hypothetical protein